jgi:hypothetical protein
MPKGVQKPVDVALRDPHDVNLHMPKFPGGATMVCLTPLREFGL